MLLALKPAKLNWKSALNAPQIVYLRPKCEKIFWEGHRCESGTATSPDPSRSGGAWILWPLALDLGPSRLLILDPPLPTKATVYITVVST